MLTNYQLPASIGNRLPCGSKIMVAMSGGVDSTTTALILKEYGYEVVGVTLRLYDQKPCSLNAKSCCTIIDIKDAKNAAKSIDIPHYVIDCTDLFKKQVIDYFVDSYAQGLTPVPCIKCNDFIKFGYMLDVAKKTGCAALATGHYVEKRVCNGINELHVGADPLKDQSYFVFNLSQEQLDFLEFPLGHITKQETRCIAGSYGLGVKDKKESQDICFVDSNGYADFVRSMNQNVFKKGEIVDMLGQVIGMHNGIVHYTVGQRRRIGISSTEPLYVVAIDAQQHRVVVGKKSDIQGEIFAVKDMQWICNDGNEYFGQEVLVKIRAVSARMPAVIWQNHGNDVFCKLLQPSAAIAPGQACVVYSGSRVLGGGWIELQSDAQQ